MMISLTYCGAEHLQMTEMRKYIIIYCYIHRVTITVKDRAFVVCNLKFHLYANIRQIVHRMIT